MTEQSWLPDPVRITVDGADLATFVMASERRAPAGDVVFCHGTPWSSLVWAETARYLSGGHRVFLWDMPGYGQSVQDPTVPVDLATQMSRFARLLSRWRLERPYVVAHDIGGAVALGAHLLHGSQYSGLFLWDAVTLDPWGSPFFRLVADHAGVFGALPAALHGALVKEYIAGAARHRLTADWVDALSQPWLGSSGQPAFYRQIAALRPEHTRPVSERLRQVRCPVKVGWGEQDPWIPVKQASWLRELLPGSPPVITLDDVGHLAPLEAPTRVCQALGGWLGWAGIPGRISQVAAELPTR